MQRKTQARGERIFQEGPPGQKGLKEKQVFGNVESLFEFSRTTHETSES